MIYIPSLAFIPILAATGYCDIKSKTIPNNITYPAAILAIVLNMLFSDISAMHIFAGGLMAFFLAFVLMNTSALGGGDLKLMTLIGFMFGYPWFLAPLVGGFMIGGMIALISKIRRNKEDTAPFGFSLALAGIAVSGWLIFLSMVD